MPESARAAPSPSSSPTSRAAPRSGSGTGRRWRLPSSATLRCCDAAVEAHGGVHFKTVGDAVQAAFPTAPEAVAAALDAQRALLAEDWGAVGPLRVRMALHAGEAAPDDRGDYLAAPLNRLSRLLATGHGGQILLSQTVQQLARGALPAGVELRDLGEHRLRDLLEPERVFQLLHPDLPDDFPAAANRWMPARTTCPLQPTPFLGREREVARGRRSSCGAPDVRLRDADRTGRHGQDAARAAGRRRAARRLPGRGLLRAAGAADRSRARPLGDRGGAGGAGGGRAAARGAPA